MKYDNQNKKIQICHIVSGDLWAGAEVMVFNLLREMIKFNDFDIRIIVFNNSRLSKELIKLGIPVQIIEEEALSFFELVRQVSYYIRYHNPDIIHSHRYKENLISFLAWRKNKRVKLIATQHGLPEFYGGDFKIKHRLIIYLNFLILKKYFDLTVPVSCDIRQLLIGKLNFPPRKLKMIYNGITIGKSVPDEFEHVDFQIGSVGRLSPVKDFDLFIEIARMVFRKWPNAFFKIAGDGPDLNRLRALLKQKESSINLSLVGHLDNLDSFYRSLYIYVNTSKHEGIPLSVLEAMSFGVPVVLPKVGGMPELIRNGKEGYLIEKRSAEAFETCLLTLLENRNLRDLLGEAARRRVRNRFSSQIMAEKYRGLYLSTVNHLTELN
jgi:glycosyltransferase involved in cell wall biosynthesis